jgi:hypothetical protein
MLPRIQEIDGDRSKDQAVKSWVQLLHKSSTTLDEGNPPVFYMSLYIAIGTSSPSSSTSILADLLLTILILRVRTCKVFLLSQMLLTVEKVTQRTVDLGLLSPAWSILLRLCSRHLR